MARYARCLKFGDGVTLNLVEADIWGKKALDSNQEFAHGYCHYFGLGTDVDYKKSFQIYEKLNSNIENIDEWSSYMIASLYYSGEGVEKNYNEAYKWFSKSALFGYSGAQYDIGYLYKYGEVDEKLFEFAFFLKKFQGCQRDMKLSFSWFSKSAAQGDTSAKSQIQNWIEY